MSYKWNIHPAIPHSTLLRSSSLLLVVVMGLMAVEGSLLQNNACYQCLQQGNRYCSTTNGPLCCTKNNTSPSCNSASCISPYPGPTTPFLGKDNNHDRTSQYDYFLNLFQCEGYQENPCTTVEELTMPSIGYIRSYPIIGEVSDYCFYEDTLTKLDYQSINFQIKLYNNSDDYYVYVWYSSDI
jgi:hypothetical protein